MNREFFTTDLMLSVAHLIPVTEAEGPGRRFARDGGGWLLRCWQIGMMTCLVITGTYTDLISCEISMINLFIITWIFSVLEREN